MPPAAEAVGTAGAEIGFIKELAANVKYGCCTTFIINGKPACVSVFRMYIIDSAVLLSNMLI